MRIAFLADIHGNAIALKAVLEDIKSDGVDKIVVLGDLCYRGVEPKRVLNLIRSLDTDVVVIKGNADEWLVRGIRKGEVPEQTIDMMNLEQEWTLSKLKQEDQSYLGNLPTEINLEISNTKIHAFHATPESLFDSLQPFDDDQIFEKKVLKRDADIFIYAHIHKAFIRYVKGKCIINTGSVGLPFDGLSHASYAIVDIGEQGFQTSVRRVKYNLAESIKLVRHSDYPNKELLSSLLENALNE